MENLNIDFVKIKKGKFVKYEDAIWEVTCDNFDGTVDISIDDIQGDISVCYVDKSKLTKSTFPKFNSLKVIGITCYTT